MYRIFGRVAGTSFRTELLIMTHLGFVNSVLRRSPLNWRDQLKEIQSLRLSSGDLAEGEGLTCWIKVLSWVALGRALVSAVYPVSFLFNFFAILSWSNPRLVLPWMGITVLRKLLDLVVLCVVGVLYVEDGLPGLRVLEFIVVESISIVPEVYNWLSVRSFYEQVRGWQRTREMPRTSSEAEGRTRPEKDSSGPIDERFSSISNVDELFPRGSLEIDEGSKSLTTLRTMESQDSYEEGDPLPLANDLTPAEKSIMLLGITRDEVENVRTKIHETLPTSSPEEPTDPGLVGQVWQREETPLEDEDAARRDRKDTKSSSTPGEAVRATTCRCSSGTNPWGNRWTVFRQSSVFPAAVRITGGSSRPTDDPWKSRNGLRRMDDLVASRSCKDLEDPPFASREAQTDFEDEDEDEPGDGFEDPRSKIVAATQTNMSHVWRHGPFRKNSERVSSKRFRDAENVGRTPRRRDGMLESVRFENAPEPSRGNRTKNRESPTSEGPPRARRSDLPGVAESPEEREARGMKALRAYNDKTLLEYKRLLETDGGVPMSYFSNSGKSPTWDPIVPDVSSSSSVAGEDCEPEEVQASPTVLPTGGWASCHVQEPSLCRYEYAAATLWGAFFHNPKDTGGTFYAGLIEEDLYPIFGNLPASMGDLVKAGGRRFSRADGLFCDSSSDVDGLFFDGSFVCGRENLSKEFLKPSEVALESPEDPRKSLVPEPPDDVKDPGNQGTRDVEDAETRQEVEPRLDATEVGVAGGFGFGVLSKFGIDRKWMRAPIKNLICGFRRYTVILSESLYPNPFNREWTGNIATVTRDRQGNRVPRDVVSTSVDESKLLHRGRDDFEKGDRDPMSMTIGELCGRLEIVTSGGLEDDDQVRRKIQESMASPEFRFLIRVVDDFRNVSRISNSTITSRSVLETRIAATSSSDLPEMGRVLRIFQVETVVSRRSSREEFSEVPDIQRFLEGERSNTLSRSTSNVFPGKDEDEEPSKVAPFFDERFPEEEDPIEKSPSRDDGPRVKLPEEEFLPEDGSSSGQAARMVASLLALLIATLAMGSEQTPETGLFGTNDPTFAPADSDSDPEVASTVSRRNSWSDVTDMEEFSATTLSSAETRESSNKDH